MTKLLSLAPTLIITAVCVFALTRGVDVMDALCTGAKKGLRTVIDMLPALIVLFAVIYLLRASSVPDIISRLLSPALHRLGIPPETSLILLLRPLSGSGALSAAGDIMMRYGADSLIGRTAAVMLGSSETTFYVIAVYFAAAKVKDTRWAIPAALAADFVGFVAAALVCRLFWG